MTDIPFARELEAAVDRMSKLVERISDPLTPAEVAVAANETLRLAAANGSHSVRVEPSLMESLAIADQHDLQREMKW